MDNTTYVILALFVAFVIVCFLYRKKINISFKKGDTVLRVIAEGGPSIQSKENGKDAATRSITSKNVQSIRCDDQTLSGNQQSIPRNRRNKPQSRLWQWRKTAMDPWRERINQALLGRAYISGVLRNDIRLRSVGAYRLSAEFDVEVLGGEIQRMRSIVGEPGGKSNQYHAILASTVIREDEDNVLDYYETDYATLRVVESNQIKVPTLFSGALVCCSELQNVYVHRRSYRVDHFPSLLHTMSGNFIPRGDFEWDHDGLKDAAAREIFEEMHVSINVDAVRYPSILIHEMETDRRIFSYLGVDISKLEAEKIAGSGEGEPISVPFRDLGNYLKRQDWTQSGLINVLAWLALGAFTVGNGPGFDSALAYEHLVGWLDGRDS